MIILVYDDEAYGAEVPMISGRTATRWIPSGSPPAKIAEISGAVFGSQGWSPCAARAICSPRPDWLDGPRDRPLVIDAKITSERGSWWLEEAFRGH